MWIACSIFWIAGMTWHVLATGPKYSIGPEAGPFVPIWTIHDVTSAVTWVVLPPLAALAFVAAAYWALNGFRPN